MTDEVAIERTQRGDRDAFRHLVEGHGRAVYRLAYRMTNNETDAEDLVQETFLRAWKQIHQFDSRAAFGTWLHRICTNCALDHIRSKKRKPVVQADETWDRNASASPGPERLAESSQVTAALLPALQQLTEMERLAFVMRHHEGLGVQEISRALQVQPGAAKNTIFRAVAEVAPRFGACKRNSMLDHLTEETLVLLYYNEPEVSAAEREHLSECEMCRRGMAELRETLRVVDNYPAPDLPSDFERKLWARIAPKLETRERPWVWFSNLVQPKVWVFATAMAVLLIGVFFAGRASKQEPRGQEAKPMVAGLSAKARERILVISLADHLERTGMLLTDISNASAQEGSLPPSDRERARDLVDEGRVMRQAFLRNGSAGNGSAGNGSERSAMLLNELERLLIEVANSPEGGSAAEIHALRQRIGSESLLFKVRVVESNLRMKGQRL